MLTQLPIGAGTCTTCVSPSEFSPLLHSSRRPKNTEATLPSSTDRVVLTGVSCFLQAHYINNRTMEVFRGVSGLASAVKDRSPPLALWRKFLYCDSLTGDVLGSVDHFEVSDRAVWQIVLQCLLGNTFMVMKKVLL